MDALLVQYPHLFNVIGTKYGSENKAIFNLPNLNDRFIQAANDKNKVGSYLSPSLPNIKGKIHHIFIIILILNYFKLVVE